MDLCEDLSMYIDDYKDARVRKECIVNVNVYFCDGVPYVDISSEDRFDRFNGKLITKTKGLKI